MQFENKVVVVTGASRGIGRAVAEAFAAGGADVAINFNLHPEEAEEVASKIRGLGRQALLCQGNVADFATMQQMMADIVKQFGRLDIAVANAAFTKRELFHEADLEKFHQTVDVTMWGSFYLFRLAAEQMIAQGQGGSLVAISSPHAFVPLPRSMAYNMSKAAVDHMARTAAIELVPHRIRVNVVHPGWIDTPGERRFASEEQIAESAKKLPWKRLGRPEEIARAVLFLSDSASDYITGSSLLVDGGITLPWGSLSVQES